MEIRTIKIIFLIVFFVIFMVGFVLLARKCSKHISKEKLTKEEKIIGYLAK